MALIVKGVFSLPLRSLQGFIDSIFTLMDVPLRRPNYSSICKRAKTVEIKYHNRSKEPIRRIAIDSTGLKVFGEEKSTAAKSVEDGASSIWASMFILMKSSQQRYN